MSSDIIATMQQRLQVLVPQALDIQDDSARHAGHAGARQGGHYRLSIVSDCFIGKASLARHRMIYDALGELMQQGIHALAIRAFTAAEATTQTKREDH